MEQAEAGKNMHYLSEVEYSTLSSEEQEKILHLQQSVLESVAHGADHMAVINEICRLEEQLLPNSIGSVMLMDDQCEVLNVYAAPSIPAEGVAQLNGLRPGPGGGSCGNVVYRRESQFVSNTFTDSRWADLRQLAHNFNLCSCWSVPIYSASRHKIIGTFALSSFEHRSPSPFHRKLLEIGSSIIGIVLERKDAEEAVRIAATAFESQNGTIITDADANILRVNRAFTDITGYSDAEVIGKNPRLLSFGEQDENFYEAMWKSVTEEGHWEGEIWNRRKNGEIYPQQLTVTAVRAPDGRIINYVGSMTDITQRKKSEEEIQRLAYYDHLTDLPNRRMLLDRLKHALAYAIRGHRSVALLFIDLDNFKILNDTLGHDKGDLLLHQVAGRLTTCVREGDTVARIGGDEFVVMLEDLSGTDLEASEQAKMVAEKILASLAYPFQLDQHDYACTSSIGIALLKDSQQEVEELLKQADIAMYQAKNAGRNTLRFFDSRMQDSINLRAEIETELRRALEKEQFQLHYQIQQNYLGEVIGAEALIRWNHPERGMIPPAQFIPIAEETGLILPIGQWVINTACAQLAAWKKQPHTQELVLAVNVSAKQFHKPGFVDQVGEAIFRHGINPMLLKLELTESLLLEDIDDTVAVMNTLNELGVQLSLDDFGTGYSSLQYLRRLPLNQLKIDQSFVQDIASNNNDATIVRTIIAMAQSMSLGVIAEGVETEEQRRLLLDNQCIHYQGFLLGRPLPAGQFESLLIRHQAGPA